MESGETRHTERPMVSVPLLVYNHKDYIRQCIESVIAQKTSFTIEVLVGDDCSTDGTQEIIKEYAEKYPEIIKPFLRKKNVGGTRNLYGLLKRAKGRYIAGLEGDDYWVDENKLQTQFDFLESHKEFIGCSHSVIMVDELGQKVPFGEKYIEGCHWGYYQSIYTFEQYKNFEMPGQGSTWFYRNIYFEPQYDYSVIQRISPMIGDRTVMLFVSAQGDWYYMQDKAMTCYRYVTNPDNSSWASWNRRDNHSYDNMLLDVRLEKCAWYLFKKRVDFREQKYLILKGAVDWWLLERDRYSKTKNMKVLLKTWKLVRPKPYYFFRIAWFYIQKHLFVSTVKYALEQGELITEDKKLAQSKWKDFNEECKDKTLVLFGGGLAFDEFIQRYGKKHSVSCVLENNKKLVGRYLEYYYNWKDMWRDKYDFSMIISPDEVRSWDRDRFVVLITSSLYQDQMAKQLKDLGFNNYYSFGIMESKKLRYRLVSNSQNEKKKGV